MKSNFKQQSLVQNFALVSVFCKKSVFLDKCNNIRAVLKIF